MSLRWHAGIMGSPRCERTKRFRMLKIEALSVLWSLQLPTFSPKTDSGNGSGGFSVLIRHLLLVMDWN